MVKFRFNGINFDSLSDLGRYMTKLFKNNIITIIASESLSRSSIMLMTDNFTFQELYRMAPDRMKRIN